MTKKDTVDINDSTYIMRIDEIEFFQEAFKKECERIGLRRFMK